MKLRETKDPFDLGINSRQTAIDGKTQVLKAHDKPLAFAGG